LFHTRDDETLVQLDRERSSLCRLPEKTSIVDGQSTAGDQILGKLEVGGGVLVSEVRPLLHDNGRTGGQDGALPAAVFVLRPGQGAL
jgi:hypothetical protein